MHRLIQFISLVVLLADSVTGEELINKSSDDILEGVNARVESMIRSEAGKPLVRAEKKPPLKKERGNFVREYSYSIVAFSARCFYVNERLDEANAALVENAQYYLDNPRTIVDRDSFHWHAEIVMRLIEMYGSKGSHHAGRMTSETEEFVLKPIWEYTKKNWLEKAEYQNSKTWHYYGSENHHAMDFTINWHFAKLAKDRPEFKIQKYDDGSSTEQQYQAWNEYIIAYCQDRGRRSLCAEMRSDGYNTTLIKGFYNFYDFGDERIRSAAGMFLDLYFAYWAEEQIDGHMGGGASRLKGNNAYQQIRTHGNAVLAWLYFDIGKQSPFRGHDIAPLTSSYRPPAVVVDIAVDAIGRGRYEIRQRAQGLASQRGSSFSVATAKEPPTIFNLKNGGILRYSYCDPAFILGTPMVEACANEEWAGISSQARWQGLIFAGENDPRIVPVPRPENNSTAFNTFWSVQSKGSLITQKLKTSKDTAEMMVWISKKGLPAPVKENEIVYIDGPGAYAAIRTGKGTFTLSDKLLTYKRETGTTSSTPPGWIMTPDDEFAPVILEVMAKSDVESFDAFKKKVTASEPVMKNSLLTYKTIYGDTLTLDTSYNSAPTINGETVNYTPNKVYDSPFLSAEFDSGIVTIQKGKRKLVLNFNELRRE